MSRICQATFATMKWSSAVSWCSSRLKACAIDDWSSVGGTAGPITVVNRAAGRSELELVTEFLELEPSAIAADVVAGENQQCLKLLESDPSALVYMSVGAALYEASRGASVRLLPLDGVAPSMGSVAAGTFPLSRPLILVTRGETSPLAQRFLAYALSSDVYDLIEGQSFVPAD